MSVDQPQPGSRPDPHEPRRTGPGEPDMLPIDPFEDPPFDPAGSEVIGPQPVIRHDRAPAIGQGDAAQPQGRPQPTPNAGPEPAPASKIRTFEQSLGGKKHEDEWNRTPNSTGAGAIHVKSFHCKLTGDSLTFIDQQINEWLDAHPQYEVKLVTTSVGTWTGKNKEPNLIVNVWV